MTAFLSNRTLPMDDAVSDEDQDVLLRNTLVRFLDIDALEPLVGSDFYAFIGPGDGSRRLGCLAAAAGYGDDPAGLCRELRRRLAASLPTEGKSLAVNGVQFPPMLMAALLETLWPGDRCMALRSVEALEAQTRIRIRPRDRRRLQQVMDAYPVRLSQHVIRQMHVSAGVRRQYLPFVGELDAGGCPETWVGPLQKGLVERMYQNRVIFLVSMRCPVYCRFCFRKHKASRRRADPGRAEVLAAVDYVRREPDVKEVLITGGDPMMNRRNLAAAIDGLMPIPHVRTLRLATRAVAYHPRWFDARKGFWRKYIHEKQRDLKMHGKRLEIATHFIHPDEISIRSLELIADFSRSGIAVYVQTPFLRGCSDNGAELVRLFRLLRGAGAEMHYIFMPCHPIQGNRAYGTSIARGLRTACYLRAHLSDRAMPHVCTATAIGKIDWHASGWAVAPAEAGGGAVWLRTPYSSRYFSAFGGAGADAGRVRVNAEGTLDVRFEGRIGDSTLFWGSRRVPAPCAGKNDTARPADLKRQALSDQRFGVPVVVCRIPGVSRVHKTRVEIDLDVWDGDLSWVLGDAAITDVVLTARRGVLQRLPAALQAAAALQGAVHVNALRLRCVEFAYAPSQFTPAVIAQLSRRNRLQAVGPLRLEIETWFLHASDVGTVHRVLTEQLRSRGITVYSCMPLLAGINDSPAAVVEAAGRLRQAGIEFHQLVVAGHALHKTAGGGAAVDVARVIDIASAVRKNGSGREIPRYVLCTGLGEVDFGLTSRLYRIQNKLFVKMFPYDSVYFRAMQPDFEWPAEIIVDDDGLPLAPLDGLTDTGGFMVIDRPPR